MCFWSAGADLFESLACHGTGRLFELNVVLHLASERVLHIEQRLLFKRYAKLLERIFLHLVQQRFITDAEIFSGAALVAAVCGERALNLTPFDQTQHAMRHV